MYPAWVIGEAVLLDPMGHPLHPAILPRPGVRAAVLNTYKQTQGGCQKKETKKHGPNERTDQNSRKLNEMEISNLSDAEFKTLVIRMFKKLSEDLKSIKMIQSEMKDTLIEIKNNSQKQQ